MNEHLKRDGHATLKLNREEKNMPTVDSDSPVTEGTKPILPEAIPLEILTELGQATTAYHDASPDRLANARETYEAALRKFQRWSPFTNL